MKIWSKGWVRARKLQRVVLHNQKHRLGKIRWGGSVALTILKLKFFESHSRSSISTTNQSLPFNNQLLKIRSLLLKLRFSLLDIDLVRVEQNDSIPSIDRQLARCSLTLATKEPFQGWLVNFGEGDEGATAGGRKNWTRGFWGVRPSGGHSSREFLLGQFGSCGMGRSVAMGTRV